MVGTTWQVIANLVQADKKSPPVEAILPKEGATGWSDTWMISSEAKHPNCMYKWMDHIISPQANAEVAEWFGEAPANSKSCALTAVKDHCKIFHADDEAYFDKVAYWNTPREAVRRRPRRRLQGLLRVGQGLDGDQGLDALVSSWPQ